MFKILSENFSLQPNPNPVRQEKYGDSGRGDILSLAALDQARKEITTWPGYRPTELRRLNGLASAAGVRTILYKDEGARFDLGSFKALGGAYAVASFLQREVEALAGKRPSTKELGAGSLKDVTTGMTVTCATDGNHGRSVAWGARTFGCRCVIFVHATVSQGRRDAIAAYGAEVRVVDGTYDDAVREAADTAARNGWQVISDTSYEGYTDIPRYVMQGYGVMVEEAVEQMPRGAFPTHVFVQGGVGGLAAAVCSYLWERFGEKSPLFYVAEPETARCLYLSAAAGRPTADHGSLDTIMAGLACGEVSLLAWSILDAGADGFFSITDASAAETMRLLADGRYGDHPIVAGESAVAGLAAALLAAGDADARHAIKLTEESVVLVIGTEGATDPAVYERIVGKAPERVVAGWSTRKELVQ
ncbi:diaminopropionate ammonia-lyase [Bradyrhizobium sp. BEA-2-5]|uniref:diaminopropionate ammonia-lyase n=1 Tax=Bradyrhizobium TaxID=374 RepID=UPI00067BBC5E|nr:MULTISPECIES: diaminopropionate ammonia-lyase [Bradyrhizobium]WOH84609.1 diaminopropionate ammonia-lyase [Bradyrhizobium sp. BEA-2-5]